MQSKVPLAVLVLLTVVTVPARASGFDDKNFDQQCFLYAQLVHQMTEVSLRQYAAGDAEKATAMLKQVQLLANKIHLSMSEDNKRLKDAQILLRHTAFRLNEMLRNSSLEDRSLVAETLAQVNQAQNEAMMQVFRK